DAQVGARHPDAEHVAWLELAWLAEGLLHRLPVGIRRVRETGGGGDHEIDEQQGEPRNGWCHDDGLRATAPGRCGDARARRQRIRCLGVDVPGEPSSWVSSVTFDTGLVK